MPVTVRCPLCAADGLRAFHRDEQRSYLQCTCCDLVCVPPPQYLSRDEELAQYRQHENDVTDAGYRRFLSRLAEPLLERLPAAAQGLDFGCGPAPALAAMLQEAGHRVSLYDSFFCDDREVLAQRYDFVTASEVVEHLHQPGAVLEQLWSCLRPGGWLGVMTKLVQDREAFAGWHYRRDPTHVCFFSRDCWRWWARQHGTSAEFAAADVILLRRPP